MSANSTTQEHHGGGAKVYIATLTALLILTAITVAASYIQFGDGATNVVVALGIATLKASLVALFFMHLKYDKPVNAVIFCSTLFFLGLFLSFCLIDAGSRDRIIPANAKVPVPVQLPVPGQLNTPAPVAPAAAHH